MKTIAAILVFLVCLFSPIGKAEALAQTSFSLAHIRVEGNSRFSADAVIAASGLRTGQSATVADFDSAGKRLLDTGMFQSVNYRYESAKNSGGKGYDLTLQVVELTYLQPVKIDLPGVNEDDLWRWLGQHDPLLLKTSPATDKALQRYTSAVEQYLKEQNRPEAVAIDEEEEPHGQGIALLIRPKVLPVVRAIKFEGIQAASSDALLKPLAKPALGSKYTEYSFRTLLDLNVRPVYEELGCLTVTFPKIETAPSASGDGVTVTVTVNEGVVYHLAKVNLDAGDFEPSDLLKAADFPVGKVADWKVITESVAKMGKVFQDNGYINATSRLQRHLDAASRNLTLDVTMDSGKQFFFGALILRGLAASAEPQARSLWKLEQGQPMDMQYLDDYKQKVFEKRAAGSRNDVQQELKQRPGTDLVDVILTFS